MKVQDNKLPVFEENERGKNTGLTYLIIWSVVLIGVVVSVTLYFDGGKDKLSLKSFFSSSRPAKEKIITKYSTGAILDKILDVRTDIRTLVYLDISKEVFIIKNDKLWNKAKIGDSVKVGYIQDTTSLIHPLDFISIQTIGKARSTKEGLSIISSEEPSEKTIIIPRVR